MFGYHGKALLVNLTTQEVRWEPLHQDTLQHFIGGIGLKSAFFPEASRQK